MLLCSQISIQAAQDTPDELHNFDRARITMKLRTLACTERCFVCRNPQLLNRALARSSNDHRT